MPISRGQMERQLRMGGGIMQVTPRQGAIFGGLKKAVKGIAKGIGSVLKSDVGKLGLLTLGGLGLASKGPLSFLGKSVLPAATSFFGGDKTFGKTMGILGGGTLLGGVLNSLSPEEKEEVSSGRNIEALRTKLTEAYKNQRTFSDSQNEDAAIAAQVESDLSEYTSGLGAYADGGRVEYAMGSPEENAMQASGIMGLPLNENPAGVTELDLRETGGFIPPVGVKEKADDIPAMLSNNEFVFTADAVRGMGDGNVNLGAKRLYDQMKKLENGGRV